MAPSEKSGVLYCDGASRGNPGPASYGYVILEEGDLAHQEGQKIGDTTNNVAEYTGLIRGLTRARAEGFHHIVVRADSELMVRQLNGVYKVKSPHIKVLFDQAKALLSQFKTWKAEHIRREQNSLADALCNQALDS